MSECCLVHDADPRHIAQAIWKTLQLGDPLLPDLAQDGCGESKGAHLRVRWAHRTAEPMFAIDVLDEIKKESWEIGVADVGKVHPVAFWRRAWGADVEPPAAWTEHIYLPNVLDPLSPRTAPTFLKMVCALASEVPVHFSSDDDRRNALQDEVSYWKGLAQAQAKLHRGERAQIQARLHATLAKTPGAEASLEPAVVKRAWKLADIAEWAAENSDRIVILPRAIKATQKSSYHNAEHLFDALEILADVYTAVKRGSMERTELRRRCDALGLDLGGSVDRSVAGEAGDEYFVRWRGDRRFLDQHLGRGTARDPRYTMRVYFTWDEVDQTVVVGSMPAHLTASMS